MKYRHRNRSHGFTLIELMVVVAIIGILAGIAIPQYQAYVAKAQVSRVMSETASLKTAVDLCVVDVKMVASVLSCAGTASGSSLLQAGGNTMDGGAPSEASLGVPTLAFDGTSGAATLTATFGNSASIAISGRTLVWSRSVTGTWTCTTTVAERYAPRGCATS